MLFRSRDDDRSTGERQAEALADVCGYVLDHAPSSVLPDAGGHRPHLNVLIRLDDLENRARAGCLDFVAGNGRLADVQSHQCLLHLEVVELDAGIFVEGLIVLGQTVSGLESAARLTGIAALQKAVGHGEVLLGLPGLLLLNLAFIANVRVEVELNLTREFLTA